MLITPTGVKGLRYVFCEAILSFLNQDRPDLYKKSNNLTSNVAHKDFYEAS